LLKPVSRSAAADERPYARSPFKQSSRNPASKLTGSSRHDDRRVIHDSHVKPRFALARRFNHAERKLIEAKAREAGMSVANYLRTCAGLPERTSGRPTVEQLEAEQDQAWEILRGLELDPAGYFPADDSWLDDYR
jgi:hypothetical protein